MTTPGAYIPTALTVAPQWPDLTPFTMTSPSQFRPKPPIALETDQWAKDYNEIKELGAKNSSSRSYGSDNRRGSGRYDRGLGR